jgi:nicotinate-nucleotide adenylyltransferase
MTMRIGMFGGSFDPVHLGHLAAVEAAMQGLCLDSCHLVPTAVPPHKKPGRLAPAADRLRMLEMTFAGREGIQLSTLELDRPGFSYTIDTVEMFSERHPEADEIVLIMGFDAFVEIETWKAHRRLFDLVQIAVLARNAGTDGGLDQDRQTRVVAQCVKRAVSDDYAVDTAMGFRLVHPGKKTVYYIPFASPVISSSSVRARIREGASLEGFVTANVADYIKEKGLY